MRLITRTKHLLNRGGAIEFIKAIFRFFYWQTGLRSARYTFEYKLNGSPVTRTINDTTANFVVTSPQEYARASTAHGEQAVISDLLANLKSDDVFYDIGANVGTYTCFAGQIIESGTVVAFEPHPANAERLDENAALNDVEANIQSVALSDEEGTDTLAVAGSTMKAGTGTHALSTGEENTIEIQTARGDQLIENDVTPQPSVLKIDVEGAEQLVLEGLRSAIENDQCRLIYCEVHPDRLSEFGGSVDELRQLLADAGYSIDVFEDRPPEYFLKATR